MIFLGHIAGQGREKPVKAKAEASSDFPVPIYMQQTTDALSWCGRKFCNNFSVIAEHLAKEQSIFGITLESPLIS